MTNNNKSAIEPFTKQLYDTGEYDSADSFKMQFKDFLLRCYIGISDFRGKGPLVDCGLPHRIEKQLSLLGKVLVVEASEDKLFLARPVGKLKTNFWTKEIIECDFVLINDDGEEKYQIGIETENKVKKTVVYNGEGKKDFIINPKKIVCFMNNDCGLPDQIGIDFWLNRLENRLGLIDYDAKKCRKKMAIFTRTKMDGDDKSDAISEFENNDYIFNIHFGSSGKGKGKKTGIDPSETNYKLSGPENSQERNHLWNDYDKFIMNLCRFHGINFQASFKQERQNIPETLAAEGHFKAWERERKQVREDAYRQCEKLGWIEKGWELNYGVQAETNEQKIKKLEEELKIVELEEKIATIKRSKLETTEQKEEKKEEGKILKSERFIIEKPNKN